MRPWLYAPHLLAAGTGFLSLSEEILWVRLFGFANHSRPQAFAFVLAAYLLGIALGARYGQRLTESPRPPWAMAGWVLLGSAALGLTTPWLFVLLVGLDDLLGTRLQVPLGGMLIILVAASKALLFPLAHHLGSSTQPGRIGRSVSRVYLCNILGSALGPLVTGFLVLDALSTQQAFALSAGLTFAAGLLCLLPAMAPAFGAALATASIALCAVPWLLDSQALVRLAAEPAGEIRKLVENRHGIITLYQGESRGGEADDIVFGGNVYDGRTNLDPVANTNQIHRLLVLPALQPQPRRVLMIGLSIGSWLKLVTGFPGVETIDVIEINPGYLRAMEDYPRHLAALSDPRVRLYADDGRRWINSHPEARYDLIVMNTTWHWRAYSNTLLAREFLSSLRQHLAPGGVVAWNTTGSPDALHTASTVFAHAYGFHSFAIAADFDWRPRLVTPAARDVLGSLTLDGQPLFPRNSERTIRTYLNTAPVSVEQQARTAGRALQTITDRNLITEYRHGRSLWW